MGGPEKGEKVPVVYPFGDLFLYIFIITLLMATFVSSYVEQKNTEYRVHGLYNVMEEINPSAILPERSDDKKLYKSTADSPSMRFMNKHRRGFPMRQDGWKNALNFGHRSYPDHPTLSLDTSTPAAFDDKKKPGFVETQIVEVVPSSLVQPQAAAADNTPKLVGQPVVLKKSNSDIEAPIILKKSGERVKSSLKLPGLARSRSMPSTPTKAVHFDDNLEHVRRFSRLDTPTAVSSDSNPFDEKVMFSWGEDDIDSNASSDDDSSSSYGSSDEEEDQQANYRNRIGYYHYMNSTEWQISLPNFVKPTPESERTETRPVYLESVFLSSDKNSIIGHVAVKNMSFEKAVTVRYTIDYWKTVTEACANYNSDVRKKQRDRGYDRFTFVINLEDLSYHSLSSKSMFLCIRYNTLGQEFWDNNASYNYQIDFTRVSKGTSIPNKFHKRSDKKSQQRSRLPGKVHQRSRSDDLDSYFPTYESDGEHAGNELLVKLDSRRNKLTSRYSFGASLKNGSHNNAMAKAAAEDAAPRPAWDSSSYRDLLNNYCFFKTDDAKSHATTTTTTTTTTTKSSSTKDASPANSSHLTTTSASVTTPKHHEFMKKPIPHTPPESPIDYGSPKSSLFV
ncbi:hypothetical protein TRVA0_004S00760 [Trichomonascus vanleenenianus]|uniref:CBM21 domain-containing protein n=1 Tax=Trichomonascus vanleenenianus TaxID=2268995 RepID=UPI003ECB3C82